MMDREKIRVRLSKRPDSSAGLLNSGVTGLWRSRTIRGILDQICRRCEPSSFVCQNKAAVA